MTQLTEVKACFTRFFGSKSSCFGFLVASGGAPEVTIDLIKVVGSLSG